MPSCLTKRESSVACVGWCCWRRRYCRGFLGGFQGHKPFCVRQTFLNLSRIFFPLVWRQFHGACFQNLLITVQTQAGTLYFLTRHRSCCSSSSEMLSLLTVLPRASSVGKCHESMQGCSQLPDPWSILRSYNSIHPVVHKDTGEVQFRMVPCSSRGPRTFSRGFTRISAFFFFHRPPFSREP